MTHSSADSNVGEDSETSEHYSLKEVEDALQAYCKTPWMEDTTQALESAITEWMSFHGGADSGEKLLKMIATHYQSLESREIADLDTMVIRSAMKVMGKMREREKANNVQCATSAIQDNVKTQAFMPKWLDVK